MRPILLLAAICLCMGCEKRYTRPASPRSAKYIPEIAGTAGFYHYMTDVAGDTIAMYNDTTATITAVNDSTLYFLGYTLSYFDAYSSTTPVDTNAIAFKADHPTNPFGITLFYYYKENKLVFREMHGSVMNPDSEYYLRK